MRSRVTGLLLALILLAAAVPAVLDCCFHASPQHAVSAVDAAASHQIHTFPDDVTAARQLPATPEDGVRGCIDHAAPTQTPYIETTTGGGASPASTRGADTTSPADFAPPVAAAHSARRTALDADSTGPPLWLSACVSRT